MSDQFDQILRAADILGLEVTQDYKIVDGSFFVVVELKKNGEVVKSFPGAASKEAIKAQLENNKQAMETQIAAIDADLAKIEAIK